MRNAWGMSWSLGRVFAVASASVCTFGCADSGVDDNVLPTAGSTTTGTTGGEGGETGPIEQTDNCRAYLECAAEATPTDLPGLITEFGPDGSCWQAGAVEAQLCDDACVAALQMTQMNAPGVEACNPGAAFPRTFRFDCVDIQMVGLGDGTSFQAQVLENAWTADIAAFKLNILFQVVSRDDMTGATELAVRSGVGTSEADLCNEPNTESAILMGAYDPAVGAFEPTSAEGQCSAMAAGGADPQGGTYSLDLGGADTLFIYAEDDDTTTFNCTPDPGTPDAVPVRGVRATFTVNATGTALSGNLVGCLAESQAMTLCSCLGECMGEGLQTMGPCADCPTGAVTLDQLLGNVGSSQGCTDLLGEPAFDLILGFTATTLPDNTMTCGG